MRRCLVSLSVLVMPLAANAGIVSQTDWLPSESDPDVQVRSILFEPDFDTSFVDFEAELPGAGYLTVGFPALEEGAAIPDVQIFNADGLELGQLSARVPNPAGAYVEVMPADDVVMVAVNLEFRAEFDFTEPNDEVLLAWPLVPFEQVDVVLFPAGDADFFSFMLKERSVVEVQLAGATSSVSPYFYQKDGSLNGYGFRKELNAGEHFVSLNFNDKALSDAAPFQMTLLVYPVHSAVPAESQLPEKLSEVTLGIPFALRDVPSDGKVSLAFEVKQPGMFRGDVSNAGGRTEVMFRDELERTFGQANAHLPRGRYIVDVSGIASTGRPQFLTIYRSVARDPLEPNDYPADASALKLDKPVEVVLEHEIPRDWLTVTPKKSGSVYLLAEAEYGHCGNLIVLVPNPDEPGLYVEAAASGSAISKSFGPIAAQAGVPVLMGLQCPDAPQDERYTVTVIAQEDIAGGKVEESPIYVIGLDLSEGARAALSTAADQNSITFLETDEAMTLDQQISAIADVESRVGRKGIGWQVILAGILAIAGAGLLLIGWRRRKSKA